MSRGQLPRYARTLRHLRASQLLWLAWRRLLPPRPARPGPHPALRADVPLLPPPYHAGPAGSDLCEQAARGLFTLLGEQRDLGFPDTDWQLGPCRTGRLWTATLHYHGWAYHLAGQDRELFRAYVDDWIERVQPGGAAGELAWCPFATATRIGWWVRIHAELGPDYWAGHAEFHERFIQSLWGQAADLARRVEWELSGNHLFRNAVGLAWAGRFFDGPRAAGWLRLATQIVEPELDEQVLPDGGHYERSLMYHIQVMEDLAALHALLEADRVVSKTGAALERMREFLLWMRHPDGTFPLFNDAAGNGAAPPGAVLGEPEGSRPPMGRRLFPDTGLVAWHSEAWSVFMDVGPGGPDHQPGHAHADTLTIEVSYRGERLIVDPGTGPYDAGPARDHDRSTAAHNTVCVDDRDSIETWGIFRVGRRHPPPFVHEGEGDSPVLFASHEGYRHLDGNPVVSRTLGYTGEALLLIEDRVDGEGVHRVSGGYLLAPGWRAERGEDGWELTREGHRLHLIVRSDANLVLSETLTSYRPEFGVEHEAVRLGWRTESVLPVAVSTTFSTEWDA